MRIHGQQLAGEEPQPSEARGSAGSRLRCGSQLALGPQQDGAVADHGDQIAVLARAQRVPGANLRLSRCRLAVDRSGAAKYRPVGRELRDDLREQGTPAHEPAREYPAASASTSTRRRGSSIVSKRFTERSCKRRMVKPIHSVCAPRDAARTAIDATGVSVHVRRFSRARSSWKCPPFRALPEASGRLSGVAEHSIARLPQSRAGWRHIAMLSLPALHGAARATVHT